METIIKLLTLLTAIALTTAAIGQRATINSDAIQSDKTNGLYILPRGRLMVGSNYSDRTEWAVERPKWVCVTNETVTREGPLRYSTTAAPGVMRTEIRESVTIDVSSNLVLRVWYSGQWKEMLLDSTPILQRTHREYSIEYQLAEIKTLMYSNSVPVFQSTTNIQIK